MGGGHAGGGGLPGVAAVEWAAAVAVAAAMAVAAVMAAAVAAAASWRRRSWRRRPTVINTLLSRIIDDAMSGAETSRSLQVLDRVGNENICASPPPLRRQGTS